MALPLRIDGQTDTGTDVPKRSLEARESDERTRQGIDTQLLRCCY